MNEAKIFFTENGPVENDQLLLQKHNGKFFPKPAIRQSETGRRRTSLLLKISEALNRGDYAIAAIYYRQSRERFNNDTIREKCLSYNSSVLIRQYNANEDRDHNGRWLTVLRQQNLQC